MTKAIGIDIGGTGIKGAIVDTDKGKLLTERVRIPTPAGGEPDAVLETVRAVLEQLGDDENLPLGIDFPTIVKDGVTLSASNVSPKWIGFEAEKFFEEGLGREVHFVNDADAAGIAELEFGAAKGVPGFVIMTTLGTGIGSAMIYNGKLIPNSELGHLKYNGEKVEKYAATSARERENLTWEEWAARLTEFYSHLEFLFSPDLFVVGGGVSKNSDDFLHLIDVETPMIPAKQRNNAGIIGSAALAARAHASIEKKAAKAQAKAAKKAVKGASKKSE